MVVNLNTLCKVQLDELGKMIWLSQADSLPDEQMDRREEILAALQSKIDENNCVELELWGIMNVFGPYINPVRNPFSSFNIEINKNPNFKYS